MRQILKYISIVLISLAALNCRNEGTISYNSIQINPDKAKPINLNELFERIELIPLETTTESLIASCNKLVEHNSKYFILDLNQHTVIAFNNQGKFLFNTKSFRGFGPKEYRTLVDFDINIRNNTLELLDAPAQKIKIYDLDGNYVDEIQLSTELLPLSHFKVLSDDVYLFYTKSVQRRKESVLFYSVQEKKVLNRTGNLPEEIHFLTSTMHNPFHSINNEMYFTHIFPNNEIYLINLSTNKLEKAFDIEFGKYNFLLNDLPIGKEKEFYRNFIKNNNDKYAFIVNVKQNNKLVLIHFLLQNEFYIAKFDKQTKETIIYSNKIGTSGQLPPPNLMENNSLTYVCEPAYIDYVIKEGLLDNRSKQVLAEVRRNNNPFIVKYIFKN